LQFAGPVIALYTVARHHERRVSLAAAAVTALALAVSAASRAAESPLFAIGIYLALVAAWAIGDNVRRRHAYLTRVQAREARTEEEQQERARVAVAEERARIARELHDVISHNVSVIVLQAAAGADVFATHPERSREALGSIETASSIWSPKRSSTRAVAAWPCLSVFVSASCTIRYAEKSMPAGSARRSPVTVSETSSPVARTRSTSSGRRVSPGGGARPAPSPAGAWTTLSSRRNSASASRRVEIVDDGTAAAEANGRTGRGHGLIGMRERAAVFGGELHAGPRSDGGFTVRASIPLEGASS
jgi:signal transduction histidine kinase